MKKLALVLSLVCASFATQAQSQMAESKLQQALNQIETTKVQLNRTERMIREALIELQSSGESILTQETIVQNVFSNMCGQNFAHTYLLKDAVKNIEANLLARCRSRGIGNCDKDLIMIHFSPASNNQCKVSGEMRI